MLWLVGAHLAPPPSLSLDVVVAEAAEDAGGAAGGGGVGARRVLGARVLERPRRAGAATVRLAVGGGSGDDVVLAVDDALAAIRLAAHAVRTAAATAGAGGSAVSVAGEGFADTGFAACRFGAVGPVVASAVSSSEMTCVAPALHDARAVRRVVDATLNGGRDYFGSEAARFGGGDSATTIAFAPPAVAVAGPFPPAVSESAARRAAASAGFFLVARGSEGGRARARSTPASLSRRGRRVRRRGRPGVASAASARWFGRSPGAGELATLVFARPRVEAADPSIAPGAGGTLVVLRGRDLAPPSAGVGGETFVAFGGTSGGASGGVSLAPLRAVSSAVALAETPASPPGVVDATARAAGDPGSAARDPRGRIRIRIRGVEFTFRAPAFVASVSPSRGPTEGGTVILARLAGAGAASAADAPLWCRVGVVAPVAARRSAARARAVGAWRRHRARRGGGVRVGEPAGLPRGGRERRAKRGVDRLRVRALGARLGGFAARGGGWERGRLRRARPPSRWRRPSRGRAARGRAAASPGVVGCAYGGTSSRGAALEHRVSRGAGDRLGWFECLLAPDPFIEGFFPVLVDGADAAGAGGRSLGGSAPQIEYVAAPHVASWRPEIAHVGGGGLVVVTGADLGGGFRGAGRAGVRLRRGAEGGGERRGGIRIRIGIFLHRRVRAVRRARRRGVFRGGGVRDPGRPPRGRRRAHGRPRGVGADERERGAPRADASARGAPRSPKSGGLEGGFAVTVVGSRLAPVSGADDLSARVGTIAPVALRPGARGRTPRSF